MDRILKFDLELNVWIHGLELPKNLDPDVLKKLHECFEQRKKSHLENQRPWLGIVRAEYLDLEGRGIPEAVLDEMYGPVLKPLPDDNKRAELLSDYFAAEMDAEVVLSKQITEILSPREQFDFLAKPATLDSFLIHPIGDCYLHLSDAQKAALRRHYQIRKSLAESRVFSPEQLKANKDAIERASSTGSKNVKLRIVAAETSEEIRARMQLFAVLEKEQLDQFLRLNRSIKPNQQTSDWIETLKGEHRKIAEEVLSTVKN